MKKLVLAVTVAFGLTGAVSAQSFIDFGPKVGFGETLLLNSQASFNSDKYLHNPKSLGFSGGFKLAFDFNRSVAIVGEVMYTQFNQVYDMTGVNNDSAATEYYYEKQISVSMLEFPLMFRYNTNGMQYFEAGYAFTKILNVSETNTADGTPINSDISDLYAANTGGLIVGVGGYMWGSGNFGVSAGLRLRYDIKNFVNDQATTGESHIYAMDGMVGDPMTRYMSVMVVFEFNYDLGFYMAKSNCGNRQMIIGN